MNCLEPPVLDISTIISTNKKTHCLSYFVEYFCSTFRVLLQYFVVPFCSTFLQYFCSTFCTSTVAWSRLNIPNRCVQKHKRLNAKYSILISICKLTLLPIPCKVMTVVQALTFDFSLSQYKFTRIIHRIHHKQECPSEAARPSRALWPHGQTFCS